jgi:hypothetical protein
MRARGTNYIVRSYPQDSELPHFTVLVTFLKLIFAFIGTVLSSSSHLDQTQIQPKAGNIL